MITETIQKSLNWLRWKNKFSLALFVFFAFTAYGQQGPFKSGELIIKLNRNTTDQVDLDEGRTNPHLIGLPSFDAVSSNVNVVSVNRAFKQEFKYAAMARGLGLDQYITVKVPNATALQELANNYSALDEVELVELNYIAEAHVVPNDPLYGEQWGLNNTGNAKQYNTGNLVGTPGADLNMEAAWDIHTGTGSITIAIIDSGVDGTHPDFAGKMVAGYDFFNDDNDPSDDDGHGTSCAGIAAASGNNGIGVAGVNWGARIMPLKALQGGSGSYEAVANSIIFAVDNGADVISMSLGGGSPASVLENAVNYAYNAGVPIFASRGNGNSTADNYPSSYSTVISVGGLSPCDTRKTPSSCDGETWWGASYGGGPDKMDFVAPAARITTTDITGSGGYSNGDYTDSFNGTSSACPFAAGIGALVLSYSPGLSPDELRDILRQTSVDIGASGYDDETGYGRLDAAAALNASIACSLGAPGNLSASNITDISFDLSWNAVSGAASYTVTIDGNSSTISGTSFTATGLTPGTTYDCSVAANCSEGGSGSSSSINVTTQNSADTQPPSTPTNLTASNTTQTSTDLSWTASTDNVGVTGYNIYIDDVFEGSTTNLTYDLTGLSPNTNYNIKLTAEDAAGNESDPAETSVTTLASVDNEAPSVPTNLSVSNITATTADLSWNASTDNVGVTGYNVYVDGSMVGSTASTSYGLSGLSPNTNYNVAVSAFDAAGNESGQAGTSFTTELVSYCDANGNSSSGEWIQAVSLGAFSNTSGNNGGYGNFTNQTAYLDPGQSYNVALTPGFSGTTYNEHWVVWIDYNKDGDFSDAGELVFSPGGSNSTVNGNINIPGSASGTTRMRIAMRWNNTPSSCGTFNYGEVEDYTVSFEGGGGDTQAPSVPTNLSASNTTQTSTNLSWNASTDNVGVTGYHVYVDGNLEATTAGTSYAVSGLTAGTTYLMEVSAFDAAGNESGRAATNVTTQSSPDNEAPSTPTNLTASNTTQTSTGLSWNPSTDNVGVSGYRVYVDGDLEATTAGTSYTVSGLTAGTTYLMEVSAFDAAGNESGRAATNVTTEENGGGPTYCTSQGNNANFEWIQSISLGAYTNTTGNDGGYGDHTDEVIGVTAGNSYNITLTPGFSGTNYPEYWRIWVDYNGDGDFSDSGEQVFSSSGSSSSTVNGTINIPASTMITTRMRISMKYNNAPSPCESFNYGEVEDYTITIINGGGGGDTEAPSTPTNLSASNTTQTSTDLSWNASTDNVGVTAYRVFVDGGFVGTTANTNYSVGGLSAATTYLMEVSAVDAAGNESGRAATNVTTEEGGGGEEPIYCDAQGNNSSYEWIQSVAIGGFTNNSGNNGGYGDYTGQTANVTAGGSYNITLTPGYSGTSYPERWSIWIDFNRDGDFTDAGEQVFSSASASTSPVNGTINIPGSVSGITRMRIAMKWNGNATSCESFQYGEVEDYSIAIGGGSAQLSSVEEQTEAAKRPELSGINRPSALNNNTSQNLEGVILYPNPVVNQLRVMLPQGVESMRIVGLNGAVVKEFNTFEKSNFIDVTDLNQGVYFLQVQTAEQVFNKRFVKQ